MKGCQVCCATRRGPRASLRCRRRRSSPSSIRRQPRNPPTPRIGAPARWPKAVGVSHRSVQRVWAGAGLKPYLVGTFKISASCRGRQRRQPFRRSGGRSPERALVLCVDEKSQIQALDRTQPGLPIKKGRAQTMTHDYKRNGTTTLFAALDVKTGQVIGQCLPRHRAKEFIKFLNKIDTAVDKALDLHLILDNYSTHKTKQVQNWLKRHTRFKLHFIPTSSSWLNMVERFFASITEKCHPPRCFRQCRRPRGSHRQLSCKPQRCPDALRMDQVCRCHLSQSRPRSANPRCGQIRVPSVRVGTLEPEARGQELKKMLPSLKDLIDCCATARSAVIKEINRLLHNQG